MSREKWQAENLLKIAKHFGCVCVLAGSREKDELFGYPSMKARLNNKKFIIGVLLLIQRLPCNLN